MNQISSILRIVCGLAILILCISMYRKMSAQIASGGEIQLMGHPIGASSGTTTLMFALIGLVGLLLLILGVVGLLKSR